MRQFWLLAPAVLFGVWFLQQLSQSMAELDDLDLTVLDL